MVGSAALSATILSRKGSTLERDPKGSMKPLWTTYVHDLKLNNDGLFRAMQRRLAYIALNHPAQLEKTQEDFGFKYNPHSWLQDQGLDVQPIKVFAFDWMHCWVEGGVWDAELCGVMHVLAPYGCVSRKLHPYSQRLRWPKMRCTRAGCVQRQCPRAGQPKKKRVGQRPK